MSVYSESARSKPRLLERKAFLSTVHRLIEAEKRAFPFLFPSPPLLPLPPFLSNCLWVPSPEADVSSGFALRLTYLLHTIMMMTTAMRNTSPAAEEPMMSGSFSWTLV